MGTGKLLGKPNKLRGNDLRWTSIPSRGSRHTPSRFMLQKPGISTGSYDPDISSTQDGFDHLPKHLKVRQKYSAPLRDVFQALSRCLEMWLNTVFRV